MRRLLLRIATAAVLLALTLLLSACGADDEEKARQGGKLVVVNAGDFEHIDPGASYYQFDYMVHYATHRTLFSNKPNDINPTPDLAQGPAEVSPDGKTVTVRLKSGIRFSPPVDREVTSKDVKYALERAFTGGVDNGYVGTYFADIKGAPEVGGEYKEIPGIETPDDRTIVFRLTRGTGAVVAQALVLPASAPVPKDYARSYDRREPNQYGTHQVFTGPYMIEADESGKLTGWEPNRRVKLVRNPNWDKETDYRPAPADEIEVQEGNEDTVAAANEVLEGRGRITGDIVAPAPVVERALSNFEDQIELPASGGWRYVALNTKLKPFDDINVRKAVIAGFDRDALRLTRGGAAIGDVATHFIPPDFPGFEESGGKEGFGLDFLAEEKGDPELSAEYFRKAGHSSGKYEGDENLLMVADDDDPGQKTAIVARERFEQLGFKVTFRQVPHETMLEKFCGAPSAEVAICPNVGWIKDFNDAQTMLQATFSGDAIAETNNSNWPQLDVPEINRAMEEAELLTETGARARAWADINRMITEQAVGIPYVWDKQANLRSDDVAGVINKWNATWDLSFTGLKE
jgi:peptide/nickel transport system substrate-binding protein